MRTIYVEPRGAELSKNNLEFQRPPSPQWWSAPCSSRGRRTRRDRLRPRGAFLDVK